MSGWTKELFDAYKDDAEYESAVLEWEIKLMKLDKKCVEQCTGCDYNKDDLCDVFLCPEAKFRVGRGISCGSTTHIGAKLVISEKKRVGQQKTKRKAIKI